MNVLQEKLASFSEEQKIRLYNDVFGSVEGKLVLEDLKMRAFYYVPEDHPDFCKSDRDVLVNVGTRKLLLEIIRMSEPLRQYEMQPKEKKDGE